MQFDTPELIISRLQAAGIWSKKRLGQHFLWDRSVLEKIVETAEIVPGDLVVEIGPGMGVLSRELLQKTDNVMAFEYDKDMVSLLSHDMPELTVIPGDVLDTAPAKLPELGSYKVVANIPYQITTPLLRLFLEGAYPPVSMTLLVQKEVGKRLTAPARSSERSYLSVLCEYFADTVYVQTIPATAFFPEPKVESGIIHLVTKPSRLFFGEEEKAFLRFVRNLFTNKRKQLKNVVAGIWGVESDVVTKLFKKLSLPMTVRAQELTLEEWVSLYNQGGKHG